MGPDGDGPGHGGPFGGHGGDMDFHSGWHMGPGWWSDAGWWPALPGLLALLGLLTVLAVLGVAWLTGGLGRRLPAGRRAPDTARQAWAAAVGRHRVVALGYAAFECDVQAVLELPGLADVRQPATARFVEAFAEAGALLTERYPSEPYAHRFVAAVERAERAWDAAVQTARRIGTSGFTTAERSLLDRVRSLLDVVRSSPFEAERRAAFEQARRRFAELEKQTGWRVPGRAALAIEARVADGLLATGS